MSAAKKPLKIVRLEAENVKRLTAVEVTPGGAPVVIIGGRNGQGKTSLLDAIAMALGGKKAQPSRPVRDGKDRAVVELDLGEVTVRRTITEAGGGTLTLKGRDGTKFGSPQALLDRVVGELTFDPLGFVRMAPQAQADVLRRLAGVDLDGFDLEEDRLRVERRELGRKLKPLQAGFAAAELEALEAQELPEAEVDTAALLQELTRRQEVNAQNRAHRDAIRSLEAQADEVGGERSRLQAALEENEKRRGHLEVELDSLRRVELTELEEAPLREELAAAGETNKAVGRRRGLLEVRGELEEGTIKVAALSGSIEEVGRLRREALEAAELPVEGLGLTDGEVTFGGVPLAQASSAEQLKVSVAMGLSLNPRLRVLLIRDGSLLDEDSLGVIAAMAAERDAQVWIERVGTGEEVSVVIEAGAVQEDRLEAGEVAP